MKILTPHSLEDYCRFIASSNRTQPYIAALKQAVKPGAIVADIGSGIGQFALMACRFGASRVYAIEPNSVIEIARELAQTNGFADRIEFIANLSTNISLPEKVDVIISDLRGALPLNEGSLYSIMDARDRFLAPNGILIPRKDTLYIAGVYAPEIYNSYQSPWETNHYGLDISIVEQLMVNTAGIKKIKPEHLALPTMKLGEVEYKSINNTDLEGIVTWDIDHNMSLHGLAIWFDSDLADGISFSCAPGTPENIHGIAFLPFSRTISVKIGNRIHCQVEIRQLIGSHYSWHWKTSVFQTKVDTIPELVLSQSTLNDAPVYVKNLQKTMNSYVPHCSPAGEIMTFVLNSMHGTLTVEHIAKSALEKFPGYFDDIRSARRFVKLLSMQYG